MYIQLGSKNQWKTLFDKKNLINHGEHSRLITWSFKLLNYTSSFICFRYKRGIVIIRYPWGSTLFYWKT